MATSEPTGGSASRKSARSRQAGLPRHNGRAASRRSSPTPPSPRPVLARLARFLEGAFPSLGASLVSRLPFPRGAPPWTPFEAPASRATVALVSACGVRRGGDPPFRSGRSRGDSSWREIPGDAAVGDLVFEPPLRAPSSDGNILFPLERLREIAAAGGVAAASPVHAGLLDLVLDADRLLDETAPAIARALQEASVGAAVLAGRGAIGTRTASLLARGLEARGIATVVVSPCAAILSRAVPPRAAVTRFPPGAPFGPPGDRGAQRDALLFALRRLESAAAPGDRSPFDRYLGPVGARGKEV